MDSTNAAVRVNVLTYNRPRLLERTLEGLPTDVELVVFDDGSDLDYTRIDRLLEARGARIFRAPHNYGKRRFGQWMELVHRDTLQSGAQLFISTADDMIPCTQFVDRVRDVWNAIDDDRKIALNLHRDSRTTCWRSGAPIDCGRVLRTGWMDGCFVCERRYYQEISKRPLRIHRPWNEQPQLGSGVYQTISQRLRQNWNIYGVKQSLVRHADGPSQMNPEARAEAPLSTIAFIDDV